MLRALTCRAVLLPESRPETERREEREEWEERAEPEARAEGEEPDEATAPAPYALAAPAPPAPVRAPGALAPWVGAVPREPPRAPLTVMPVGGEPSAPSGATTGASPQVSQYSSPPPTSSYRPSQPGR
ncbi:hypothetical protein [Streptomyces sp. SPB074]|uniref:hypothetical protein n=1 Tax=Streptomyces sp. (strain SPB074) TaxID=465543 RepID=UPI00017F1C94